MGDYGQTQAEIPGNIPGAPAAEEDVSVLVTGFGVSAKFYPPLLLIKLGSDDKIESPY